MAEGRFPRIVIAAPQSGSGKTTIVTGLLAALRKQGLQPQPYKIGPDYIDPGYHEIAAGRKGHNLDSWLVPADKIQDIFCRSAAAADISIIEGVMGLYDGGQNGISSTAALAKLLQAPVILVLDVKSMGDSAAAIALGFKQYDPAVEIAGVILNRVGSESHRQMIVRALENIDIPVLGAVFRNENLHMPERHLGLLPAGENDAAGLIDKIGETIASSVAVDEIRRIAAAAPLLPLAQKAAKPGVKDVTIAVAQDEAFSFYYPASLAVLEEMGANIVYFSPLADEKIPAVAAGVIIGGGFPEMFAQRLAANSAMRRSLRLAAEKQLPIYAECGGFMYLTEFLTDFAGEKHAMTGIIPGGCQMNAKLQTVGYVEAKLQADTILGPAETMLRGHEFHFSSQSLAAEKEAPFPWAFEFKKNRTQQKYPGGFAAGSVLASYLHVHFAGNLPAAECFIGHCRTFQKQRMQAEAE